MYLLYLSASGEATFLADLLEYNVLLLLSGVVTAIPLLLFVAAARRLQLATVGFLQYITPSLHFILAVAVFAEPFSQTQLISFLLIWVGLAVCSVDAILKHRRLRLMSSAVAR